MLGRRQTNPLPRPRRLHRRKWQFRGCDGVGWPITFPRKGDTLPPPDERARAGKFGHGDVKYVGPSEGEADGDAREGVNGEGKKKRRFSRLFRRKEKGGDGKGWSEGGDVVR